MSETILRACDHVAAMATHGACPVCVRTPVTRGHLESREGGPLFGSMAPLPLARVHTRSADEARGMPTFEDELACVAICTVLVCGMPGLVFAGLMQTLGAWA